MEYWDGTWPEPGDYLVTEAGSAYLVDEIRPAREGSTSSVFTACCIKSTVEEAFAAHDDTDVGAKLYGLQWAKRRKHNRFPT